MAYKFAESLIEKINYKNRLLYIALLSFLIGCLGFAGYVFAGTKSAGPLELSYSGDTLFSESNMAPGFSTSKVLTVTNNGTINHSFALATDSVSGDELKNLISLSPIYNGAVVWTKTIDELSSLPEGSLTVVDNIAPGETVVVDLALVLDSSADNSAQTKVLSFDIIFGIQEAEPLSGEVLVSQLGSVNVAPQGAGEEAGDAENEAVLSSEPGDGQVKGASDENGEQENPWLLLIVPAFTVGGLAFMSSSVLRNIGLPLFAGSVTYILSTFIKGDLDPQTFWGVLGGEIIIAGGLKFVLQDMHKDWFRENWQKLKKKFNW